MAIVERGLISSIEGDMVRVKVPERNDDVTVPLRVPKHILLVLGDSMEDAPPDTIYVKQAELAVDMWVAFTQFTDMDGVVLAILEDLE